jgi:hypothetical protein
VWANMPPRHRLLIVVIATSLCLNFVLSQELRPLAFESETSSPSHQSNSNDNEDYDNSVISNTRNNNNNNNQEAHEEESSEDEEGGGGGEEEEYNEGEDGGSEEDGEDDEGEETEAQGSVLNLQYALPLSTNLTQLSAYPRGDTNVSASSIIYRTADLDTAATG